MLQFLIYFMKKISPKNQFWFILKKDKFSRNIKKGIILKNIKILYRNNFSLLRILLINLYKIFKCHIIKYKNSKTISIINKQYNNFIFFFAVWMQPSEPLYIQSNWLINTVNSKSIYLHDGKIKDNKKVRYQSIIIYFFT